MPTNRIPRIIAGVLATGGIGWGLFLLAFNPLAPVIPAFLFGYLVTAWYVARVFRTPSLTTCRVMWAVSLVTHGWWLVAAVFGTGSFAHPIFVIWWVSASVLSVVGLLTEFRSERTCSRAIGHCRV